MARLCLNCEVLNAVAFVRDKMDWRFHRYSERKCNVATLKGPALLHHVSALITSQ
jgi:hypothetical protein